MHVTLGHLRWKVYNFVKVLQFIIKNERYNLGSKKIIVKNKTKRYNLCEEAVRFLNDMLKYRILDELKERFWVLVTNAWLQRQQYGSNFQMKEFGR